MSTSHPTFVEVITSDSDNDDDDSSDAEVQYVPYVKPPPPVIDLLMSSSEDEEEEISPKKKTPKAKKSTPTTEAKWISTNHSRPSSSKSSSTLYFAPTRSADHHAKPGSDFPPPIPPTRVSNTGQITERTLIHATGSKKSAGEDGERSNGFKSTGWIIDTNGGHDPSPNTNVALNSSLSTRNEHNQQQQRHVVNHSTAAADAASSFPREPRVRGSSAVYDFESGGNDPLGGGGAPLPSCASTTTTGNNNVGEVGVEAAKQLGGTGGCLNKAGEGSHAAQGGQNGTHPTMWLPQSSGRGKKGGLVEPEPPVNGVALAPTTPSPAAAPTPRKRVSKQQRARQRTNEEINNFLTTLGIFEPNEAPPAATPPKRVRKSRARPLIIPPNVQALSLIPPPPLMDSDPSNFLSLATTEVNDATLPATTATTTKETEAPVMMETVSEDVVLPIVNQPVDNSAHGDVPLDVEKLFCPPFNPHIPTAEVGILSRTERAALSFNVSSVLAPTSVPSSDPEPLPDRNDSPEIAPPQDKSDNNNTILLSGSDEPLDGDQSGVDVESIPKASLLNFSTEKTTEFKFPLENNFEDEHSDSDDEEGYSKSLPAYLPSHWTPTMVKYYDCASTEDFRLSKVLASMSDDPELWETNEARFPRQKMNSRVRCLNCNQFGHVVWKCNEKRKQAICHLCGQSGHGSAAKNRDSGRQTRCPNGVCLNCGRKQRGTISHGCPQCIYTKYPLKCGSCSVEGHTTSHCPDNWRRFFSTTTTASIIGRERKRNETAFGDKPIYRLHKDTYCATCSQKGHGFFHCRSHCRTSGDKYARQNPRIFHELPRIQAPPVASAVREEESTVERREEIPMGSTSTSSRVPDSIDPPAPTNNHEEQQDGQLLAEVGEASSPLSENEPGDDNNSPQMKKCMDPECHNRLKEKTYCHEMPMVPPEHRLLLKAQEDNKINIMLGNTDQITVLQKRHAIHIYGVDVVQSQVDMLLLVSKLNAEAKNSAKPKKNNNSPEVITLDDDDDQEDEDESERGGVTNSNEKVTIALLHSEWGPMLDELKPNGFITRLIDTFKVDIHVSKETVTIENGTPKGKMMAHKNIVDWLECLSASVKYTMKMKLDLEEEEDDDARSVSIISENNNMSPSPAKKRKRPRQVQRPHSRRFNKRQRLSQNNSQSQGDNSMPHSSQGQLSSEFKRGTGTRSTCPNPSLPGFKLQPWEYNFPQVDLIPKSESISKKKKQQEIRKQRRQRQKMRKQQQQQRQFFNSGPPFPQQNDGFVPFYSDDYGHPPPPPLMSLPNPLMSTEFSPPFFHAQHVPVPEFVPQQGGGGPSSSSSQPLTDYIAFRVSDSELPRGRSHNKKGHARNTGGGNWILGGGTRRPKNRGRGGGGGGHASNNGRPRYYNDGKNGNV